MSEAVINSIVLVLKKIHKRQNIVYYIFPFLCFSLSLRQNISTIMSTIVGRKREIRSSRRVDELTSRITGAEFLMRFPDSLTGTGNFIWWDANSPAPRYKQE